MDTTRDVPLVRKDTKIKRMTATAPDIFGQKTVKHCMNTVHFSDRKTKSSCNCILFKSTSIILKGIYV